MKNMQAVELTCLYESKTNPRKFFDKNKMAELVASVKQDGVITPLIVRLTGGGAGPFEIIAGARRYRAAKVAGLKEVPAIVRKLSDEQALQLQIIENDQRTDVHPLEQCDAYQKLLESVEAHPLRNQAEGIRKVAALVGKSEIYIRQRLAYANLIEPVRKLFYEGEITPTHALLVARLLPEQQKSQDVMRSLRNSESVNSLADTIQRAFFLRLKDAPFNPEDAALVPKAGACSLCPKRTGFNKSLFPDVKEDDTCTDPACYESKTVAFVKIQVDLHPDAKPLTVGTSYNAKPKGLTDWQKAGEKRCENTETGIVIEQLSHYPPDRQKAKLGAVLAVCINEKCKTHNAHVYDAAYEARTGTTRKAEKARRIELKRRALVFASLATRTFTPNQRPILDHAIKSLSHDNARALCNAMGWDAPTHYGGKDYATSVEKHLAKLTADGIDRWLYLLMLAETDLWMYSGYTGKTKLLDAKAKQSGVKLAALALEAKQKRVAVKAKKAA